MTATQKETWKNRIREFYIELSNMQVLFASAEKALIEVNSSTNLTEKIGFFVRECLTIEHFGPQIDWFKGTIRKVCSGEIEPSEAATMILTSRQEIIELMECFNKEELFTDVEHVLAISVSKN